MFLIITVGRCVPWRTQADVNQFSGLNGKARFDSSFLGTLLGQASKRHTYMRNLWICFGLLEHICTRDHVHFRTHAEASVVRIRLSARRILIRTYILMEPYVVCVHMYRTRRVYDVAQDEVVTYSLMNIWLNGC